MKSRIILFLILLHSISIPAKHIIFDLGNVLIGTSKFSFARRVGLKKFILYALIDRKNPGAIKEKVFEILDLLGEQQPVDGLLATHDGRALPKVMCEWLSGQLSHKKIIRLAKAKISELNSSGYFSSKRERKLVLSIIKTMFSPKQLAKNSYVIPEGLKLLEDIIYRYGGEHDLYILSNWDPVSFDHLPHNQPIKKLFSYFDPAHIFISGRCGYIKPDPAIYNAFLEAYQLDPAECIFIDDQATNIQGAQSSGIAGIHLIDNKYNEVRKKLDEILV